MDAENLSFNNSANTEIVEDLCAVLPRVSITILSDGLIVKSIDCGNLSSFMVTSKESDVSWILQFQAE
jgi:hypothetical protein